MGFGCSLRHIKLVADDLGGLALDQAVEDLALARGNRLLRLHLQHRELPHKPLMLGWLG